jgi:superfamily II DNA helicase RecQ
MAATPGDVLKRVFGYESLRGQQQATIEHTLSGGDSLAEFADIPGVGEKKLECYGKDFLEVIARHGTT